LKLRQTLSVSVFLTVCHYIWVLPCFGAADTPTRESKNSVELIQKYSLQLAEPNIHPPLFKFIPNAAHSLEFIDNDQIAYLDKNKVVIWDLKTRKTVDEIYHPTQCEIASFAFSADRNYIALGGQKECYLSILELRGKKTVIFSQSAPVEQTPFFDTVGIPRKIIFSRNGRSIWLGDTGGSVMRWYLKRENYWKNEFYNVPLSLDDMVLASDEGIIAAASRSILLLWDPKNNQELVDVIKTESLSADIAFSSGKNWLAYPLGHRQDLKLVVYDTNNKKIVSQSKEFLPLMKGQTISSTMHVIFSPDDQVIYALVLYFTTIERKMYFYLVVIEVVTGAILAKFESKEIFDPSGIDRFDYLAVSPNGRILATSGDHKIIFWDIKGHPVSPNIKTEK